jgi:hypothetical protein
MRNLLNETNLTRKMLLDPNFSDCYCESRRDAHFQPSSVVIRYFTAEYDEKRLKWKSLFPTPKLGVLGNYSPWGPMMMKPP